MKLNRSNLSQLASAPQLTSASGLSQVKVPNYLDKPLTQSIVHIGVGGFHRAHQAVYTHKLLQAGSDEQWSICGLGLREADKAMQTALAEQDYLYSVIELAPNDTNQVTVVGAISDFLFAPENPQAVLDKLSDPSVRIVSLTITEGGYNVDDSTGLFNEKHPDVVYDLANPTTPRTMFGFITEALSLRQQAGIAPFTVMSCDNLPHNGDVTRKALMAFAQLKDAALANWIDANVTFPNSMVDRITPVTKDTHRQWLQQTHGIDDAWPVVCEPFIQWVLEDKFCNGRPEWQTVGVEFTDDVTPYELAKIRLLNASHVAMAYLGYLAGYRYAHEVMEDATFAEFIRAFMDEDVTPILAHINEVDLPAYKQILRERFANRQIGDQLERLCSDGSSKIPKFLIPTINTMLANGQSLQRVALIVASWAHYLRGKDDNGNSHSINDPLAERLQNSVAKRATLSADFLNLHDIFGSAIGNSQAFFEAFEKALIQLETEGALATLKDTPKATLASEQKPT